MRKQVEAYLKDAYGKERARPNVEDGHFTFGKIGNNECKFKKTEIKMKYTLFLLCKWVNKRKLWNTL